jgi:hypothetical protein
LDHFFKFYWFFSSILSTELFLLLFICLFLILLLSHSVFFLFLLYFVGFIFYILFLLTFSLYYALYLLHDFAFLFCWNWYLFCLSSWTFLQLFGELTPTHISSLHFFYIYIVFNSKVCFQFKCKTSFYYKFHRYFVSTHFTLYRLDRFLFVHVFYCFFIVWYCIEHWFYLFYNIHTAMIYQVFILKTVLAFPRIRPETKIA